MIQIEIVDKIVFIERDFFEMEKKNQPCCDHSHEVFDHYHGHHSHEKNDVLEHHASVWDELVCHLPFAVFSVALAMVCLSFVSYLDMATGKSLAYRLFHNFHYLHIVFAATGTVLVFFKYSKNMILGLLVGIFVPATFCTVSDAFLPYLGGRFVGLDMDLHWCFISHLDVVLPFLLAGIINGLAMSTHPMSRRLFYSFSFHFVHIFVSSMAAILYLISFGFYEWWDRMGFVFVFLVAAVLIPCTMSDVVVPMLFAKTKIKKRNRNT